VFTTGTNCFKTTDGGIITYKYIFEWLKMFDASEFCSELLFRKFINQLIFQIEVIK